MLDLVLDYNENSHEPVYVQVKNRLRDELRSGKLKSFNKLPSVRQLAKMAGVSVGTMGRVVTELVDEGFCIRRPRIGIYVNRESSLLGQKTLIHLQSGTLAHEIAYGQRVMALGESSLYPNCNVQSWYVTSDRLHSSGLQAELEKIKNVHPDILLIEAQEFERKEVKELLELPFPVLFIGDFKFGEYKDPDLNQLREDTAERGYELMRSVHLAGCKNAALYGGIGKDSFYGELFLSGVKRGIKDFDIDLRYYKLAEGDYKSLSTDELYTMKKKHLKAMLDDGVPEVVVFEGHTEIDEVVEIIGELGYEVGSDIKLISNRELVSGGIFVQPDYSLFRCHAAEIINTMIKNSKYHPGSITLSGEIKYRTISINNL